MHYEIRRNEILGLDFVVTKKRNIKFKDGVWYSRNELRHLSFFRKKCGVEKYNKLLPFIHQMKKNLDLDVQSCFEYGD